MVIRTAKPEDLDRLMELELLCVGTAESITKEQLAGRIAVYPQHFYIAWAEETPLGFINGMATDRPTLTDDLFEKARLHEEEGAWQMVFLLCTRPEFRRQGIGAALLRTLIGDARARNRRGVVLTCKDELIPYYEKFGFHNEGESVSVFGGAKWYQMRLTF